MRSVHNFDLWSILLFRQEQCRPCAKSFGTFALDSALQCVGAVTPKRTLSSLPVQATSVERDLLAGAARAVHWPNVYKPKLQLCLRLHAAGWQWSGGFALDTPGDLFVKIRHRLAPHSQPAAPAPIQKWGCNPRMIEKRVSSRLVLQIQMVSPNSAS